MIKELITVIVPIYNVETYLNKCVSSIRQQSYENLEIILVDDGSTDNCPQICDCLMNMDDRIRVIHQENGGRSVARNRGLEEAKGEYLIFVDGDDWIETNCIQTLYELSKKYESTLTVGRYKSIYKDKIIDKSTNQILVLSNDEPIEFLIKGKDGFQNVNSVCVKLYKRELVNNIRFEEGKYYEDIMFTTKVYQACKKCVYVDTALYNYNIGTETSITFAGVNELTFRDEIPCFEKKELFLNEIGRKDLADIYSFFKYQKLLTYYRWCMSEGEASGVEYGKQIHKIVFSQRDKVKYLCACKKGTRVERWSLKLFMTNRKLYQMFYRLLEQYGNIKQKLR